MSFADFINIVNLILSLPIKIWKYIKWLRYKLIPQNFNIALSISFREGLNSGNYYSEIKNNINKFLNDFRLNKQIKLIDLSDIHIFKTNEEASKFILKGEINVLIWGVFTTDNLKIEGEIVNDLRINITYRHPTDDKNLVGELIKSDLISNTSHRNKWRIFDKSSFEDLRIISNNLIDLATYILALSLKTFLKIEESTVLFERLYESIKNYDNKMAFSLIGHLTNNYEYLILYSHTVLKDINKAIIYCDKFLNLNPNDVRILNYLAYFQFIIGNRELSKSLVEKAYKINLNFSTTKINLAFYKILDNDYDKAFRLYESITKTEIKDIYFEPIDVVDFLSKRYNEERNPAFLYGSGIISYYFGDKKIAKKDLALFVKKADKVKMKKMYRYANKLLKTLNH